VPPPPSLHALAPNPCNPRRVQGFLCLSDTVASIGPQLAVVSTTPGPPDALAHPLLSIADHDSTLMLSFAQALHVSKAWQFEKLWPFSLLAWLLAQPDTENVRPC